MEYKDTKSCGETPGTETRMDRYRWNIFGICKVRWKNFGETTEEGHTMFFSAKEDKHEHGIGVLVYKDIVNTLRGCRPISSRLITIRMRAAPFNITVVQAYAQRQTMMRKKYKNYITRYRTSLIRYRKRTFLLCKETGMQKWAKMLVETVKPFAEPSAMTTQMRKD